MAIMHCLHGVEDTPGSGRESVDFDVKVRRDAGCGAASYRTADACLKP
jgi:hypothetical protein